jgi:hypothetical protein
MIRAKRNDMTITRRLAALLAGIERKILGTAVAASSIYPM